MKSGIKTTEFWVTLAMVVGSVLVAVLNPEQATTVGEKAEWTGGLLATVAMIVGGVSAGCYAVSRMLIKKNGGGGA